MLTPNHTLHNLHRTPNFLNLSYVLTRFNRDYALGFRSESQKVNKMQVLHSDFAS